MTLRIGWLARLGQNINIIIPTNTVVVQQATDVYLILVEVTISLDEVLQLGQVGRQPVPLSYSPVHSYVLLFYM